MPPCLRSAWSSVVRASTGGRRSGGSQRNPVASGAGCACPIPRGSGRRRRSPPKPRPAVHGRRTEFAGPMKATPRTRSECSAASSSPRKPPNETPATTARSTPMVSSTAMQSATNSSGKYDVLLRRPVRTAVPSTVDGDHSVPTGQVGHLALPMATVVDRPSGQQQHCRLVLRTEHLEEDLDAVPLDETVPVRQHCTHPSTPSW